MNRHLRHSSSPPALDLLTRSLTQRDLEMHYPLLTEDGKGLGSNQSAIPKKCHFASVYTEHG